MAYLITAAVLLLGIAAAAIGLTMPFVNAHVSALDINVANENFSSPDRTRVFVQALLVIAGVLSMQTIRGLMKRSRFVTATLIALTTAVGLLLGFPIYWLLDLTSLAGGASSEGSAVGVAADASPASGLIIYAVGVIIFAGGVMRLWHIAKTQR